MPNSPCTAWQLSKRVIDKGGRLAALTKPTMATAVLIFSRPRCTAWMDNIKTWTERSVEESIRMTEDRDKWRKYVHGVANPRIEDG